jgi:hypothetical protein
MKKLLALTLILLAMLGVFFLFAQKKQESAPLDEPVMEIKDEVVENIPEIIPIPPLDTMLFDALLLKNANGDSTGKWPVITEHPLPGAILPFHRIVAYYGNFYSKQMGALGEYEPEEMKRRLLEEVAAWELADPETPVIPAIHYIAVTAQASEGFDGKYRARMPFSQIDKAIAIAKEINGLVFIDIQTGFSTYADEIPRLKEYLSLPYVHLGIDPEFNMKTGKKPGTVIGSVDAEEINFVTEYLASLVRENDIPPKILVIHRFTQPMVKNASHIILRKEVQIVMHMDGWGPGPNKITTYREFVAKEPVQFTGFKIFYKNDQRKPGSVLLTPPELLRLAPSPLYIQYQ